MKQKYYIGLDMGTSSVGWALTDENYKIIRKKGKDMWGCRMFKEAATSSERRTKRTARRRLQREKARIGYIREYFADEISEVDAGFFQRLDDSKYFMEDKSENQPYSIFADKNFTDKDYYEKYPTIFHLRKELAESDAVHDVRLVYLAVHNIFKHRGHFLNAVLNDGDMDSIEELYNNLSSKMAEYLGITIREISDTKWLEDILTSKQHSNSGKLKAITEKLSLNKSLDKVQIEMWKLVCGLKGTISDIFVNDMFNEDNKKFSLSFRDINFEEKNIQAEEMISDDAYDIFCVLKKMNDWSVLANIMRGENKTYEFISQARVAVYEKHKKDLEILKALYKKNVPDEYNDMFRVMKDNNYSAYVGSVNSEKCVIRRGAKIDSDVFFKNVKKTVEKFPESEEKQYVLGEIDKGMFLPKQITNANGVIPNQVHKKELRKILENAEHYLEFLRKRDESGYTVSERIIKLFEFKIPYYVGPVSATADESSHSKNVWSVRRERGAVMPWNFEQKIDIKASAEEFIKRMVNHCTYINGETVLPKNSLMYERFMVLNELNNLRINGERLDVIDMHLKQKIYNELFRSGKKITGKRLEDYLKKTGIIDGDETANISGIDGDFVNRLANYKKFCEVFDADILTYEQEKMAEQIIFWATVYGDEKKFLKSKIKEVYKDKLNENQIKRILGFRFKDWGRLSRELLETEGADVETGEIKTVIGRMWDDSLNLMELIASKKYTYKEAIEKKQTAIERNLSEITYDDLTELYVSAPVKRMIWQTVLVLKEVTGIMGNEPSKIFVEMARDAKSEKERKESRKKKFAELYKNCKDDGIDWSKEILNTDEAEFRRKKLYLYYTQKGYCMYTGERIPIVDLFKDNLYDIDHIYPRHFVKDDSIENNLVLVKKETNAHKKDRYPIEINIRNSWGGLWKTLRDGGFISDEKFKRLTRNTEFTDDERAGFINRQLVETRQGTKVIADLLKRTFVNTEIVYVKAGNVSMFRQEFDCIKCRAVNDYHHANDAYLNIVVGNVYNTKFTQNPYNFIKEYDKNPEKNRYHMYRMFDYNVERNGTYAWRADNGESIGIVKKMLSRNTPIVTRMNYEEKGGISDQNIVSADKAKKAKGVGYIPIKGSDEKLKDVCKYGGYTNTAGAYFFLVEYELKGKKVRSLEAVPVYLKETLNTKEKMAAYCEKQLGYKNPVVRYEKIKMYSLIKVNGFYLYLTGRGGNKLWVTNAVQLVLDKELMEYARILDKEDIHENDAVMEKHGISREQNEKLYEALNKKHNNAIYAKRPNPVGKKLSEGKELFEKLRISEQMYVLKQILTLTQSVNNGADLTYINGAKTAGVSTLNKKISDNNKEFILINQSVAGLYENKIDLLKI